MDALATRCAESIAYLHMLHAVPAQPQRNSTTNLSHYKEGYTLSFDEERRLTGVLAFLSSIRNDPNYIPAICIRERRKPSYLDVLIAVNKGSADDGNDMLRELENGFNNLFEVLSRTCDADATTLEQEAFAVIVSLCSSRILYRLRFKKSPSKPPVKKVLQDALSALQNLGLSSVHPLFIKQAKELVKLLDVYSKHQTQYELEAVIEGFHRFEQSQDISSALDAIPNRLMDPGSRGNLLNTIRKVSRYREYASILCRLAKRHSLLRRMNVMQVQLGPKAFRRAPIEHLQPQLAFKTAKAISKNGNPHKFKNVCRLLGTTIPTADRVFAKQTRKTLKEGKVHAEIQLLFHCEQEKYDFPPRVVCSSKDACFLCNTFISIYGKVHTPRSHGKLYPGWRLPHVGTIDLHSKFVEHLDLLIKSSLDTLILRGKQTLYHCPNESTLLTLPVSTTTLRSQGTNHETTAQEIENTSSHQSLPEIAVRDFGIEKLTDTLESRNNSDGGGSNNERLATVIEEAETATGTGILHEKDLKHDASPVFPLPELRSNVITTEEDAPVLNSGQLPKLVSANKASPFYSDGVLAVQVEYSAGATMSGGLSKQLPFSVDWLDVDEKEAARLGQTWHELLEGEEVSLSLNDQNSVFITAGGSLVKVTFGLPMATGGEVRSAGAEDSHS